MCLRHRVSESRGGPAPWFEAGKAKRELTARGYLPSRQDRKGKLIYFPGFMPTKNAKTLKRLEG